MERSAKQKNEASICLFDSCANVSFYRVDLNSGAVVLLESLDLGVFIFGEGGWVFRVLFLLVLAVVCFGARSNEGQPFYCRGQLTTKRLASFEGSKKSLTGVVWVSGLDTKWELFLWGEGVVIFGQEPLLRWGQELNYLKTKSDRKQKNELFDFFFVRKVCCGLGLFRLSNLRFDKIGRWGLRRRKATDIGPKNG